MAGIDVVPASPFAGADARARAWSGSPIDPRKLLEAWQSRQPGSAVGNTRYRWDLSHEHCPVPAFAGPPETWRAWRPADQPELDRAPLRFEERFALPIAIAEGCEYLEEIAASDGECAAGMRELLVECDPVLHRDLALTVVAAHSWADTFSLFCLSRAPRTLERLRPIALALGTSYAAIASRAGGVVLGMRYPFHDKPLVSASAQLAAGLICLGLDLPVAAALVDFVRREQRASGGWGDAAGPEDIATTFVATDLLVQTDPSFDPESAARFIIERQEPTGFWRAMGPEVPWLTAGVGTTLASLSLSFAQRFRWPTVPVANRDRKTGLPFYAYFDDLTHLFADLEGISRASTELAFIDLIGFRAFNNAQGQDVGDAVLRAFADELRTVPGCAPIRDGGDEFLLVGAPTKHGLFDDLESFRRAWPERFRARFGSGAPPVAPRILVKATGCSALRATREMLGRDIGELKHTHPSPGPEGVLVMAK